MGRRARTRSFITWSVALRSTALGQAHGVEAASRAFFTRGVCAVRTPNIGARNPSILRTNRDGRWCGCLGKRSGKSPARCVAILRTSLIRWLQ